MRLALLAAFFLSSCVCVCDADALVRDVAAEDAVDCGRATRNDRAPVLACVQEAIQRGVPFYGGWARIGRDTEVRTYLAQDERGEVWMFGYDGGLSGSCPYLGGHRCASALAIETDTDGEYLACSGSPDSQIVLCHR